MQEMQETQVWSLGQEDPLAEEMATHFSILAWKVAMDRGAWQTTVHSVSDSDTTAHAHTQHTGPLPFLQNCFVSDH